MIRPIIIINAIVYLCWFFLLQTEAGATFMAQNFLVSWQGLVEGRIWTLITSVFSHEMFFHLFINMFVLMSFGRIIESALGTKRFLKFYFVAGIISSLSHSMVSAFILGQPDLPALGASGAISGLVLLFALMFPKAKILLLGLIPMPAIWGAIAFIGFDLWGLVAQAQGGGLPIGHGAHLGGALTGIIYYFLVLRKERITLTSYS